VDGGMPNFKRKKAAKARVGHHFKIPVYGESITGEVFNTVLNL
jgi:hypothetical protein